MKRAAISALALGLVLGVVLPALAHDGAHGKGTPTKMEGWVACECCGAQNANAAGKDCTIACHKSGKALVLVSGGKSYKLTDQKAALAHVGHEVVVTGTVGDDGTITVTSIETKKV